MAGTEILGPGARAHEALQDPGAAPGAPPAPRGLTCAITLGLAFLRPPRPSLHNKGSEGNASHLLAPSPQPQTNSTGLSRGPPAKRPARRGQAGAQPLPRAARPPRPPPSPRGPGFPSAPPPRAQRRPRSPPESCFHGSLRRPLLTNSLPSPVPKPPPLGTSLRRSPGGSHHTPAADPRLREAQGRRERSVARSGPPGCLRGPRGPEGTSPRGHPPPPRPPPRSAPLPAPSPPPCPTRTRAPRPPGFARPSPRPARLPRASASSSPARCL